MQIVYRFTRAHLVGRGTLKVPENASDEEIVKSVLQKIANQCGERIWFSMRRATSPVLCVGREFVDPEGIQPAVISLLEDVSICIDKDNWRKIDVNPL